MKKTGFTLSEWIYQANHSKNFENFKLYVLEIYDDNERFIKIGRTFTSVQQRYSEDGSLPYSYVILKEVVDNPFRIWKLEIKLKKQFKQYKVIPLKKFKGSSECFDIEITKFIEDIK